MPESMASSVLCQSSLDDCVPHGFLNQRLINVMATLLFCLGIEPPVFLRKYPLPAPFLRRIGIFVVERSWHLNTSPAFGQVFLMDRLELSADGLETVS